MPTISLPEPPAPFACSICEMPAMASKLGSGCQSCPAFKGTHFYPTSEGDSYADIVVVGDVPSIPKKAPAGVVQAQEFMHHAFRDEGGRVIKNALTSILKKDARYEHLRIRYIYAVKCAVETPNKGTVVACSTHLKQELNTIAAARGQKITVIACGVTALHSLGLTVRSEKEAMGRVYENVKFGSATLTVIFTRSLKSISSAVGKHSSLLADVERAVRHALHLEVRILSREEIEKDYEYPNTIEEVRALVDRILAYKEPIDQKTLEWPIAVDTETNTLHPHAPGAEMIAFSVAWDDGKSATIPLWHRECPYTPAEAWTEVVRLVLSGKPLIWFNGKFDQKMFWAKGLPQREVGNTCWDVMLAEHVLEEDKKGQYSLKYMTKEQLPWMSGYEDRLHDELEASEAAELATVEYQAKNTTKSVKVLPVLAQALQEAVDAGHIKDVNFKAASIMKAIDKGTYTGDDANRLRMLVNAKKNGEFNGKAIALRKKEKKNKGQGGYENASLAELRFYAAVDTDATRRLGMMQFRRMREEDTRLARWRVQIRQEVANSPMPEDQGKIVKVLFEGPDPLPTLVQDSYLPRQVELAKIEYNGIRVDSEYHAWGAQALDNTITVTTQKVFELCERQFKLGSGKQLAQHLFWGGVGYKHPDPDLAEQMARENPTTVRFEEGRITYKSEHYTATGQMQTSAQVLKHLVSRYKCPLANLILTLKKADTARNSFFENIGILSQMFGDGKIHPGYNLTGTSTGRLSSSSGVEGVGYNSQNIPKGLIGAMKDAMGNLLRDQYNRVIFDGVNCKKLFIPDDREIEAFGNADAKGAEVSIFAGYANDIPLIEALIQGMDAHCFFASEALNPNLVAEGQTGNDRRLALERAGVDDLHAWSYEDFYKGKDCGYGKPGPGGDVCVLGEHAYCKRLKVLRDNIKRLVFGLLYGAGVKKIAEIAGIKLDLAQKIKELLFNRFPSIQKYMDQTIWEMRQFNMVETYYGRRRRFLLGRNAPSMLRAKAERQAINFKIQATNSDIVLTVLCWIANVIERDLGGRLLLTVHDSIGFQVPKRYAHQIPAIFKEYGTDRVAKLCPWLPVPYRWDVELGPSYGETVGAEQYLAALPPPMPDPQLDGYIEEEMLDDLRDPDLYEVSVRKNPLPNKKVVA